MALLMALIAVGFWLRKITATGVVIVIIVINIMGFVITFFMMISFFFLNYTFTVVTLEMSSSFSGLMIWTMLEGISFSNYLILNVPFSRIQPQFLGWKIGAFAIVSLFHIVDVICSFDFFFVTQEHGGNDLLLIDP